MKKYLLLLALLLVSLAGLGQEPEEPISLDGSISSDIGSGKSPNRNQNGFESTVAKQLPIGVRSWRIDEHLGRGDSCAVDTLITSFQDNTLGLGFLQLRLGLGRGHRRVLPKEME